MKLFATYNEIWEALVSRGEENEDTCRFESHFADLLASKYGESADNWEVLEISSGVAAFLINIEEGLIDTKLISELHACLLSTIPELCVFIHVFNGPISAPATTVVAAVVIMESELWVWVGNSLIVAALPDSAPSAPRG
jgi:hypothetical protein